MKIVIIMVKMMIMMIMIIYLRIFDGTKVDDDRGEKEY